MQQDHSHSKVFIKLLAPGEEQEVLAEWANFGPRSEEGLQGELARPHPYDACEKVVDNMHGKVALVIYGLLFAAVYLGFVVSISAGVGQTGTAATVSTAGAMPRWRDVNNTRRSPIGLLRPKTKQRSRRVPIHTPQVVEHEVFPASAVEELLSVGQP